MRNAIIKIGALALVFTGFVAGNASDSSAYERISRQYEGIRQALLHDHMGGIPDASQRMQAELQALEKDFNPFTAGISEENAADCQTILKALASAVTGLGSAGDIDAARKSFGEMSKAMVRYRQLAGDEETVVVYCSMAKGVWLQPKGELGNPYYGQSMATCGEIVSQ